MLKTITDNKLAEDILSVFKRLQVADGQELLDVAKVLFSRDPNEQSEGRDYAMQAITREAYERIHEGEMDHPLSPLLHDVIAVSVEHFGVGSW